jgi:hypothetical protein
MRCRSQNGHNMADRSLKSVTAVHEHLWQAGVRIQEIHLASRMVRSIGQRRVPLEDTLAIQGDHIAHIPGLLGRSTENARTLLYRASKIPLVPLISRPALPEMTVSQHCHGSKCRE